MKTPVATIATLDALSVWNETFLMHVDPGGENELRTIPDAGNLLRQYNL